METLSVQQIPGRLETVEGNGGGGATRWRGPSPEPRWVIAIVGEPGPGQKETTS